MNFDIGLLLAQDGIVNGAVYVLLALALVLVYAVTRVIFIIQGEFIAYGALTLAALNSGIVPGTVWALIVVATLLVGKDLWSALRNPKLRRKRMLAALGWSAVTLVTVSAVVACKGASVPLLLQIAVTVLISAVMGPMLYRVVFEPAQGASVLVLLIIAVATHMVLTGLGLIFFGPEGVRTPALINARWQIGPLMISGQSAVVMMLSLLLSLGLYFFFKHSLYGKALRATALNRAGARIVGIPPTLTGMITFSLAAALGSLSGILISPITTIYYDSGFVIGLKGFVGAIVGGLASYPISALGALGVGLLESYGSFWASSYKEVIVFSLIVPVLLWRSLAGDHVKEDE
jgi:branched-chain amino acid transport system permease protein